MSRVKRLAEDSIKDANELVAFDNRSTETGAASIIARAGLAALLIYLRVVGHDRDD